MYQIDEPYIHRMNIARIMVAQHVIDFGKRAGIIFSVTPVIDMQAFVGVQIMESQGAQSLETRDSRQRRCCDRTGKSRKAKPHEVTARRIVEESHGTKVEMRSLETVASMP